MKYRVEFIKVNDKIPMNDFLSILSKDEKADIYAHIDKLLDFKNKNQNIPEKLSKYLKEGIFELRVKHKTRISRSLYFFQKDGFIYFLFGFIKKTEKTPNEVIYRAMKMKNNK